MFKLSLTTLCACIISLASYNTKVFSQVNWQTKEVDIPYDEFPVLGLAFGIGYEPLSKTDVNNNAHIWSSGEITNFRKSNLLKEIGINGIYEHDVKLKYKAAVPYLTGGLKGVISINDIEDDAIRIAGRKLTFHFGSGWSATETRFFLASNETALDDRFVKSVTSPPENINPFDYETLMEQHGPTEKKWKSVVPVGFTPSALSNWEWQIGRFQPSINNIDGFVLKNLNTYSGDAELSTDIVANYTIDDKNRVAGWSLTTEDGHYVMSYKNGGTTDEPGSENAHCGFIYRLDESELADFNGDGNINNTDRDVPVYTLHYKVHFFRPASTTCNTDFDHIIDTYTQDITFNTYSSYVNTSHGNEPPSLLKFPFYTKKYRAMAQSNAVQENYAIIEKILNLKSWGEAKNASIGTGCPKYQIVRLDCWVERRKPINFWVRGLRIRSDQAEAILKRESSAISTIANYFQAMRTDLIGRKDVTVTPNVSAWDNVRGFEFGNEPSAPTFRVLAEIDRICEANTRPGLHTYPFIANNKPHLTRWSHYRIMYEDQTGKVPLNLTSENLDFFHTKWNSSSILNLPYPKDGIAYELRNYKINNASVFYNPHTPLTGEDIPTNDKGDNPGTTYNYSNYTSRMQGLLNDQLQTSFLHSGHYTTPSYAKDDSKLSARYLAHISTVMALPTMSDYVPTQDLQKNIIKYLKGNGVNRDCDPYGNKVFPYTKLKRLIINSDQSETILDNMGLECTTCASKTISTAYRSGLPSEIRAQGWNALCFGAKGFVFNAIGADASDNLGVYYEDYLKGGNYYLPSVSELGANGIMSDNALRLVIRGVGTCKYPLLSLGTDESANLTDRIVERNGGTEHKYIPVYDIYGTNGLLNKGLNYEILPSDILSYIGEYTSKINASYFDGETDWVARMEGCDGVQKWSAFSNTIEVAGCSKWGNYRYPWSGKHLKIWLPMYFGFKDRFDGARRLVDDVRPIAKTLSELHYQSTINRIDVASSLDNDVEANGDNEVVAIRSIKSFRLNDPQSAGNDKVFTYDPSSNSKYDFDGQITENRSDQFYQIGLFKHPAEEDARYLIICNQRTWPITYKHEDQSNPNKNTGIFMNDPTYTGSDPVADGARLEGAIDVRKVSFRINRLAFTDFSNINTLTHFTVTNLRTGEEKLIQFGTQQGSEFTDRFEIILEPGEGTLLKISPAYSIAAGMTSEAGMAYNNGHRVALLGSNVPAQKKVIVWEKNGRIFYNVTNTPSGETPLENKIANQNNGGLALPVPSVVGTDIILSHPSVAANPDGDVVVVYAFEDPNSNAVTSRRVFAQWGKYNLGTGTIDWNTIPTFTLDGQVKRDQTEEPDQLVTPVITTGQQGGFLCAWSIADDGQGNTQGKHNIKLSYIKLKFDVNNDLIVEVPWIHILNQNELTSVSSIFPTLASRDESQVGDNKEYFHLAWEGVSTTSTASATAESQIYYQKFEHDLSQTSLSPVGIVDRVTRTVSGCKHHHPNIGVSNNKIIDVNGQTVAVHGDPIVTWEREESFDYIPLPMSVLDGFPMVGSVKPPGRSVLVRSKSAGNWLRVDYINPKSSNIPLPQVVPGIDMVYFPYPQQVAISNYWVTYMNQPDNTVGVTRYYPQTSTTKKYSSYLLPESGLYPNIALRYTPGLTDPDPLLLNTIAFRGTHSIIDENDNKLFHARVTAPIVDELLVTAPKVSAIRLPAVSKDPKCKNPFNFIVKKPNRFPAIWCTGCPDTIYFASGTGIPLDWNNYDITDTRPGYYNESDTTIFQWPRTEDSVRTEDFEYSLGDTLSFDRIFYMEDTAWVKELINDSTLGEITYSVLLKDSATHQTIATLDRITIDTASIDIAVKRFGEDNITSVSAFLPPMPSPTSFYTPQGPGRKVQWVANTLAPSGKAYMTIHASKDEDMPVVMSQEHGEYDNFDVIIPMIDTAAFKQAGQQPIIASGPTTPITLSINPNPFEGSTKVTVETVKDAPLSVQVYNVLGGLVADLFNNMSTQTHYEFTLDSKVIRPGTYFIRAQAGNGVVTKKVQFVK